MLYTSYTLESTKKDFRYTWKSYTNHKTLVLIPALEHMLVASLILKVVFLDNEAT